MAVIIKVHPSSPVIKFRGIINFNNFLRTLRKAIIDQGYTFFEAGHEFKAQETGGDAKINWEATRKVSGFLQYRLNIYMFARDFRDIDVVKDGQKMTLQQTRILVEFQGQMEMDYTNAFERSKIMKAVREFLLNYVWRKKVTGTWADDLYFTIYKLHRIAKEALGMETITDASRYRVI